MKKGNQFYLELSIYGERNEILDISKVKKVQFTIGDLTKYYTPYSTEVTYDDIKMCFKIWLTEEETFNFNNNVTIEARILFDDNTVLGSEIINEPFTPSLSSEAIDV